MEHGRRSFLLQLSLAAMIMLLNIDLCSAVEHLVGDDKGWDPHSNLHGWASHKLFRVGDNLWFAYASGEHSVLEVKSREAWEACDNNNPIRLYNGGVDSVPLVHEGSKFFSSGRVEDCRNGMKLHINVDAPGSSSESKSKPSWPLMAARMKNFAAQAPTSGSPAKSHFSIFCLCHARINPWLRRKYGGIEMEKASIVKDAMTYIQHLQNQVKEIECHIAALQSNNLQRDCSSSSIVSDNDSSIGMRDMNALQIHKHLYHPETAGAHPMPPARSIHAAQSVLQMKLAR